MRPLAYARASAAEDAIALVAGDPASAFLAGGTTEVDLIRAGVSRSARLVDINALPLDGVEGTADGGLRIGALARMNDVARTPIVAERFPAISRALLLGASEQLRNMASLGGNLRQRTRCASTSTWPGPRRAATRGRAGRGRSGWVGAACSPA